ncbi:sucrase ferredoxin [Microlunatus panaciterrae]
MIEHPGPWPVNAFAGSGIAPDVQQAINVAAHQAQARILLVRRPGRQARRTRRAWAVLSYDGASVWGHWQSDSDLLQSVEVLKAPPFPTSGQGDQVLLVCAHGVHDVCCAVRGRPVALALQAEWPEATWECSHVGGDRFAANLVVLPDGVYYGGLDPLTAVETVRAHLDGRVHTDSLRGMSVFRPPAQAAVAAVHRRYGPFGPRDVDVRSAAHTDDGGWTIELSAADRRFMAKVVTQHRPPARLTCQATQDARALEYHIEELAELQPG